MGTPGQLLRPLGVNSVWVEQGAAGKRDGGQEHPRASEGHWVNSEQEEEIESISV